MITVANRIWMRSLYRALRSFFAASLITASLPACAETQAWHDFAARFVTAAGRVVDSGQGGISHSEGQGIAMLAAAAQGDRERFDRLWRWTAQELQVREDRLLAWRWEAERGVTDRNNASDGDLLVAWALARAYQRWGDAAQRDAAAELARAIRTRLLRQTAFGPVLLPGREGFEPAEGPVVNLSYWVFPALRALAAVDPAPEWAALEASGLAILGAARFGRWQLPADWLQLRGDKLVPAPGFPARFGYDAWRIPLYLHWAGLATPQRLAPFHEYWAHFDGARFLAAWTLLSDDSVDSHGASPGMRAVVALVRGQPMSPYGADGDYYSAALALAARLAARDAAAEPVR
jgi:endoglucanase